MFLLDTDVLSALRRRERNLDIVRWVEKQRTADLYLSVVTVGEIERGIAQQDRRDPSFARELALWLDRLLDWYGERVLPVDSATARRWGRLSATLGHEGADLLIAATALEHGLTVVTRNVRHFEPTGVPVVRALRVGGHGSSVRGRYWPGRLRWPEISPLILSPSPQPSPIKGRGGSRRRPRTRASLGSPSRPRCGGGRTPSASPIRGGRCRRRWSRERGARRGRPARRGRAESRALASGAGRYGVGQLPGAGCGVVPASRYTTVSMRSAGAAASLTIASAASRM